MPTSININTISDEAKDPTLKKVIMAVEYQRRREYNLLCWNKKKYESEKSEPKLSMANYAAVSFSFSIGRGRLAQKITILQVAHSMHEHGLSGHGERLAIGLAINDAIGKGWKPIDEEREELKSLGDIPPPPSEKDLRRFAYALENIQVTLYTERGPCNWSKNGETPCETLLNRLFINDTNHRVFHSVDYDEYTEGNFRSVYLQKFELDMKLEAENKKKRPLQEILKSPDVTAESDDVTAESEQDVSGKMKSTQTEKPWIKDVQRIVDAFEADKVSALEDIQPSKPPEERSTSQADAPSDIASPQKRHSTDLASILQRLIKPVVTTSQSVTSTTGSTISTPKKLVQPQLSFTPRRHSVSQADAGLSTSSVTNTTSSTTSTTSATPAGELKPVMKPK